MSEFKETWRPVFRSCPSETKLRFDSDIRPVIGSGLDYENATNKPSINGVVLVGNKSNEDIDIRSLTNLEIEAILK